ncbi:MAG: hypothetical protein IPL79_05530 [Myxococcales bacterium]|nr:hypothetical protein [Myxococcales bacterium]
MAGTTKQITWRSPSRVAIWAHRGASNAATENTIAAFDLALAEGADGVELDVRLAKSGEVMVFHDASLQRLALRTGAIEHMPYREIARVSLVGDHRIPTLDQALEACRHIAVNVELKPAHNVAALAAAVVGIIARHPRLRIIVSSFSSPALAAVAKRAPQLALAVLTDRAVSSVTLATARRLGAVAIHPNIATLSEGAIKAIQRAGLAANVFTVDHAAALHRLGAWRPDGVFTNCPGSARAVLGGRASATSAVVRTARA